VAGYFDGLIGFLDHAVAEDFLTPRHRDSILVDSDPRALLDRMRAFAQPEGERLMGRANR
jgi:predicted Rossmann-fold nucleotide-binding protein